MNAEIRALQAAMERDGYVADPAIATAAYLAREMRKPLLVEGEAGVGKTELAKVLARVLGTELVRLQCYEGLDTNTALYEWNYQRQLLRLRIAERETHDPDALEDLIFAREYLLERPLLRAITRTAGPPVLLIDEVDRADDGFEAFLLEVLSDFQVTVPELGTIRATHVPYVVLTSNRTREIGDALRRRCLYLYVEHPGFEKELAILHAKVPGSTSTSRARSRASSRPFASAICASSRASPSRSTGRRRSCASPRPPRAGARPRHARLPAQGRARRPGHRRSGGRRAGLAAASRAEP